MFRITGVTGRTIHRLQMTLKIENNTLKVSRCSDQILRLVVTASLIMKSQNYEGSIDCTSTTGSILQQSFSLCEIHKCFFEFVLLNEILRLLVVLFESIDILICMEDFVL